MKIAVQPVMAHGLFIAPIMTDGENALSIIGAAQGAVAITTPQPKMTLSKTAVVLLVERGLPGIAMLI